MTIEKLNREIRIGSFFRFSIASRNENLTGIVLDYNDKWIIIKRCFDYRLDGYTLFKRTKVLSIHYGKDELQTMKILELKGYNYKNDISIPIHDVENSLEFIKNNYSLLQIDDKEGESFDVVRFLGKNKLLYIFQELTVRAEWRYELKLPERELNILSFDNDYLNSLSLIIEE